MLGNPDTEGGKFQEKNSKFIERLIEWYDSKIKIIFEDVVYIVMIKLYMQIITLWKIFT